MTNIIYFLLSAFLIGQFGGKVGAGGKVGSGGGSVTGGGVTYVQSCSAVSASSGSTVSCVFGSAIAAGDLIHACINNSTSPITWSDSGTFLPDMISASSTNSLCYYTVSAGGGSTTLTATQTSDFFFSAITADEFHCVPACSLDVNDYPTPGVAVSVAPSTTPTSNVITPTAGDLVLGYSTTDLSFAPVYTAGSGFTLGGAQNTGYASSANEYILSSTGSVSALFTISSSGSWYAHVVSFKP